MDKVIKVDDNETTTIVTAVVIPIIIVSMISVIVSAIWKNKNRTGSKEIVQPIKTTVASFTNILHN